MKAGVRLTTYIIGPFALLVAILAIAPTAFGLGSGRGFGIHPAFVGAFKFYLGCVVIGAFLGAAFGLLGGLIRRGRASGDGSGLWAALNRPIGRPPMTEIVINPDIHDLVRPELNRRRWRWLRVCAWIVLGLLGLVQIAAFAFGVHVGRDVDRRLAAAIAASDRDDPNWRMDDLMAAREIVPDAENSAIVVSNALDLLPRNWPSEPSVPGQPNPPPGAVQIAFDAMGETDDHRRLDGPTAEVLRSEMKEHSEAVQLARTVADMRRGRHEIEISRSLIDTLLPETQAARTAARLLEVDSAIRAQDGDIDGALDSCRAIFGVGRSIGDEPFLISGLVRIAIGGVAMKSVRRVLGQGEPSDAALARLQADIQLETQPPILLRGMRGERAQMDEIIRRIRDEENPIASLSGDTPEDEPVPRLAPWVRLMFDNQRAIGLEWMLDMIAIAKAPAWQRAAMWDAWEAKLNRERKRTFAPFRATIPILMMPAGMRPRWRNRDTTQCSERLRS